MKVGGRKLLAFAITQVGLVGLGAMAVAWGDPAQVAATLTGIGSSVTMALAFFCGGNVGEHFARKPPAAVPTVVPTVVAGEPPEGP